VHLLVEEEWQYHTTVKGHQCMDLPTCFKGSLELATLRSFRVVLWQAHAANEVAELADGDNRLLILAVIFVPALGWVTPAAQLFLNLSSSCPSQFS